MPDARKDKRTLLSLKIRYKSATLEDFIERYSSDISRGGVFIKAKKPLAVGTLLKFEFILQDQSTLIHGVGRVVWRREEGGADNPPGMGLKFIKMDAESRAVVQRIAEDRAELGVFDHGKDGAPLESTASSSSGNLAPEDQTKVRHVSEFLASALEEGGAGEAATREAQAGAARARRVSDDRTAAARGAFATNKDLPNQPRHSISDAPARGAMSAFGGSGMSAGARMSSAAAPAMEEFDAADDFLDDETTKIHDTYGSEYPADVDATVIAKEAAEPFVAERRPTPVMPQVAASSSPLENAVPDLFGPDVVDSFGPAAGEFIDTALLDPSVPTVPPSAAAVPEAPGIPAEAFKISQATEPVWTTRPTPPEKNVSRGIPGLIVFAVLLLGGGTAVWQLGYADDLMDLAASYVGQFEKVAEAPASAPVPTKQVEEAEPSTEAAPSEEPATVAEAAPVEAAPVEEAQPIAEAVAEPGIVSFQVTSRPAGAFVSVNGKGAGRTPLTLDYEAGSKLSIFSKARGYLARRQHVIVADEQAPVNLVLSPLPYVVEVLSDPAGAQASSVGGGQTTTPGKLQFKSMPASRKIVVSMDGHKSATKTVTRADFTEEPRRMSAKVSVTLHEDGAPPAEPAAPSAQAAPAAPSAEEPPPVEVEVEAEAPAAPEAVEEAATPIETSAVETP